MCKPLIFLLLMFSSNLIFSQISLETVGFNIIYNHNFLHQFNSFGEDLNPVPQSIGVVSNRVPMSSGGSVNIDDGFYGSIMYSFFIPRKVVLNDSLNMTLSGFSFRFSREIFHWVPANNFSVLTSYGFSSGRYKLWGDKRANQKNQFFRIELGLQPRLQIRKFVFSIHTFYGIDIGSGKWKKSWFNRVSQIELPKFTQGGLDIGVGIGYIF